MKLHTTSPFFIARQKWEADYLRALMVETNGNMAELARRTGIDRGSLYRRLRKMGLSCNAIRPKPVESPCQKKKHVLANVPNKDIEHGFTLDSNAERSSLHADRPQAG